MQRFFNLVWTVTLLLTSSLIIARTAEAAIIRTGESITISENEKNLSDLYLFGNTINVDAPITNDLVAGGGTVTVNNNITGNLLTAGGTLNLKGNTGSSVRAAGGTITIDGIIERDLVLAGGTIDITESAVINGDLILAGGQINMRGDVKGKAIVNGGQVNIDGKIDKQLEGRIENLTLGPNAVIGGNLSYSSPQKAVINQGAQIKGDELFNKTERRRNGGVNNYAGFITAFTLYKILADIVVSLLAVYFLGGFIQKLFSQIAVREPFKNSVYGLIFVIIMPIAALFLLALFWLSAAVFLFYILILIITALFAKIFLGWLIVRWWYRRDKIVYTLDWKAAVIGPILAGLIGIIPVLGWLLLALIYLITAGTLIQSSLNTARTQRLPAKKK